MTDAPSARVLCVSGDSGTGKTTLVRHLLARLPRPLAETAVVKHTHHPVDWHPAGKDSALLWDAGPEALAVAGPDQTALFERAGRPGNDGGDGGRRRDGDDAGTAATRRLARVCRRLPPEVRLVLAEGFRDARAPKIWTVAGPPGPGRPPPGVVAVVAPAAHRDRWREEHGATEVFARDEADAVAARVGEWAAPVAGLTGR